MNIQKVKYIIYGIIIFLCAILWMKWQVANPPEEPSQQTQSQTTTNDQKARTDNADHITSKAPSAASNNITDNQNYITVKTDKYNIKINPIGGNIVKAELLKYPVSYHSKQKVALLNNSKNKFYVANSGFQSKSIPNNIKFSSAKQSYQLKGRHKLTVSLKAKHNGVTITKNYTFTEGKYQVHLDQKITNNSKASISGQAYTELVRTPHEAKQSLLHSYTTYTGAVISTQDKNYQKIKFKEMRESPVNQINKGGWVAMQQHYFISAWIPSPGNTNRFYSHVQNNHYGIGIAYPKIEIKPGKTKAQDALLYVGPSEANRLQAVAPHLDKTIDYGWLWFISDIIFSLMSWIYQYVGNWGFAIVLTTIIIKFIFYPLSAKAYRSMAKMRELAPRIEQLKANYKDDKQKLSSATMSLYKEEKVNPLGGCLPMLIQIPVFIALYWVLMENVELRQAPFILWIHDLSVHDPYYILPVLMGGSMFLQQKLNPAPSDPMQAKVMMFLPVVFTVLFLSFPAGLVLYWLVNNLTSISQQWWVMHSYRKKQQQKKITQR